jgi:hypothetical protein
VFGAASSWDTKVTAVPIPLATIPDSPSKSNLNRYLVNSKINYCFIKAVNFLNKNIWASTQMTRINNIIIIITQYELVNKVEK